MMNILIRQAVSPDIEYLSRFEHCVKTNCVWQMSQVKGDGQIQSNFVETILPREMRLSYPRSPDSLQDRWKNYTTTLVACIDNAPIGYTTINTEFSPDMIWVYDLVVDELWRRKGVASALFQAIHGWGEARNFSRITIEMSSKNFPAICLAKKLSFEFSGFNDNYFVNKDIALFFSRYLNRI